MAAEVVEGQVAAVEVAVVVVEGRQQVAAAVVVVAVVAAVAVEAGAVGVRW